MLAFCYSLNSISSEWDLIHNFKNVMWEHMFKIINNRFIFLNLQITHIQLAYNEIMSNAKINLISCNLLIIHF